MGAKVFSYQLDSWWTTTHSKSRVGLPSTHPPSRYRNQPLLPGAKVCPFASQGSHRGKGQMPAAEARLEKGTL